MVWIDTPSHILGLCPLPFHIATGLFFGGSKKLAHRLILGWGWGGVSRPHSHHLHSYLMDLQWHERQARTTFVWLQGAAGGLVSWTPAMPAPRYRLVFGVFSPSHCTLPSWPTWLWGCLLPPSQPLWWFTHHHLPPAPSLGSSLFTHSWDSGWQASGHFYSLLLRDPVQLSLEPQGTSYNVCHEEACMRSWQWRGYVPAEEAYTIGSSFLFSVLEEQRAISS